MIGVVKYTCGFPTSKQSGLWNSLRAYIRAGPFNEIRLSRVGLLKGMMEPSFCQPSVNFTIIIVS